MTEKLGWTSTQLNFDYSAINKKSFYIPLKAELTSLDHLPVLMKLSSSDPNLLTNAQLLLIDRDKHPLEQNFQYLDVSTLESQRIALAPNEKGYRLILLIISATNLPEGSINLNILTKTPEQIKANAVDMMDPVEFSDRYMPNKYGIVFKEHLFIPEEVHFSLHLRLRKGGLPVIGSKTKEMTPEEQLNILRLLKLELFEGENVIASSQGYNQAYLTHINLRNSGKEFLLVCKFDITELPEVMQASEELQDLNWVMRVVASDSIATAKDTRKEDREEAIRKSWETTQPGRQEQAKQNRLRYIAQNKKNKGEALTDQEADQLKETWADRRKLKKEQEASGKPKPKGKEDKKVKEAEKPQNAELEIPKAEDHVMHSVQKFLNHVHSDRLKVMKSLSTPHLFTSSIIEEVKAQDKSQLQEFALIQEQRKAARQQNKQIMEANKEFYKQQMTDMKEMFESAIGKYKETRQGYQARCDKRKEIITKLQTALQANDLITIENTLNEQLAISCDPVLLNQCYKAISKLNK